MTGSKHPYETNHPGDRRKKRGKTTKRIFKGKKLNQRRKDLEGEGTEEGRFRTGRKA